MWVDGVGVIDPGGDEPEHGGGVGQRDDADVVAFESLHEGLGHPVALGRTDGREAGHEAELLGEVARFGGRVARAVVAQVLDGM